MNGEFNGTPTSIPFDKINYNFVYYVVAKQIEISVSVDILNDLGETEDIKAFKENIDIQPGRQYTIKVGKDGLSISSN